MDNIRPTRRKRGSEKTDCENGEHTESREDENRLGDKNYPTPGKEVRKGGLKHKKSKSGVKLRKQKNQSTVKKIKRKRNRILERRLAN